MARGRKSTNIKTITGRDAKLLYQLSKTGITAVDQASYYCGLSKERINKLENSGYIKTSNHVVNGQTNKIITLNKLGKEYCTENFDTKSFCQAQTNHLTHDLRLTEMYYQLDTKIQETWTHERDLIKEIYEKYPEMKGELKNCVDARIEVNGEYIAIESRGVSYTDADIEIKEEIATTFLECSSMEVF
jgi:hypothetical protein